MVGSQVLARTVQLSNASGLMMPRVGLGTYRARGNAVKEAVKTALAQGLRHIDTASIYKVRGSGRRRVARTARRAAGWWRLVHAQP